MMFCSVFKALHYQLFFFAVEYLVVCFVLGCSALWCVLIACFSMW